MNSGPMTPGLEGAVPFRGRLGGDCALRLGVPRGAGGSVAAVGGYGVGGYGVGGSAEGGPQSLARPIASHHGRSPHEVGGPSDGTGTCTAWTRGAPAGRPRLSRTVSPRVAGMRGPDCLPSPRGRAGRCRSAGKPRKSAADVARPPACSQASLPGRRGGGSRGLQTPSRTQSCCPVGGPGPAPRAEPRNREVDWPEPGGNGSPVRRASGPAALLPSPRARRRRPASRIPAPAPLCTEISVSCPNRNGDRLSEKWGSCSDLLPFRSPFPAAVGRGRPFGQTGLGHRPRGNRIGKIPSGKFHERGPSLAVAPRSPGIRHGDGVHPPAPRFSLGTTLPTLLLLYHYFVLFLLPPLCHQVQVRLLPIATAFCPTGSDATGLPCRVHPGSRGRPRGARADSVTACRSESFLPAARPPGRVPL